MVFTSMFNNLVELPTTTEQLIAYAEAQPVQDWMKKGLIPAVCKLVPEPELYRLRYLPFSRLHYEEVHVPNNFIAVGDATCAFNPIYGQVRRPPRAGMLRCNDAFVQGMTQIAQARPVTRMIALGAKRSIELLRPGCRPPQRAQSWTQASLGGFRRPSPWCGLAGGKFRMKAC
jgi:hypothetical protein